MVLELVSNTGGLGIEIDRLRDWVESARDKSRRDPTNRRPAGPGPDVEITLLVGFFQIDCDDRHSNPNTGLELMELEPALE